jgi:hypothetical protein
VITSKRNTILLLVTVTLVAVYAWLQHKTHVLEYWDFIFFGLFIGLHLLMHMGHGHGHSHKHGKEQEVEKE